MSHVRLIKAVIQLEPVSISTIHLETDIKKKKMLLLTCLRHLRCKQRAPHLPVTQNHDRFSYLRKFDVFNFLMELKGKISTGVMHTASLIHRLENGMEFDSRGACSFGI